MLQGESVPDKPVSVSVRPRRWLVVQASALLESVAVGNYLAYGGGPVPHYGGAPSVPALVDPSRLSVAVTVRDSGEPVRLDLLRQEGSARRVVWTGYQSEQHIQLVWVWDLYRIQSYVVLRAALPAEDSAPPGPIWQAALDLIRACQPGDDIRCDAVALSGPIRQAHRLTSPAVEWEP